MRKSRFWTALLVTWTLPGLAVACAGGGCVASWRLVQPDLSQCSALPFLNPGNDSRLNLWLLSDDINPMPNDNAVKPDQNNLYSISSYFDLVAKITPADHKVSTPAFLAYGEGSICVSAPQGLADFTAAVNASVIPSEEKEALIKARGTISEACAQPDPKTLPLTIPELKSRQGQAFIQYLAAASAFYTGEYNPALLGFQQLSSDTDPWLKEAASYMTGRVLLNMAEVGAFDPTSGDLTPEPKDMDGLKNAETAFQTYIKAYPQGCYTASARGLMRRLYWLEGDQARLNDEYDQILRAKGTESVTQITIGQEVDAKALFPHGENPIDIAGHSPLLLATNDLIGLRKADDKIALTAQALAAQKADFAGQEKLYDYLQAARAFYADSDYKTTLALLSPAQAAPQSHLDFSREVLRGMALNALADASAQSLWSGLITNAKTPLERETAELGLAGYWDKQHTINKVFVAASPIDSPRLREILLRYEAGPIILRQQASDQAVPQAERDLALFVLLYKDVTRGHYDGFLKDYATYASSGRLGAQDKSKALENSSDNLAKLSIFSWPGSEKPYACRSLNETMQQLVSASKDSHAQLCLGEFIRINGLDQFVLDQPLEKDQLGAEKSIFPGEPFSRGEIYKKIMNDTNAPESDRAYAYDRAIRCYAPTGNNSCGGTQVDKAVRKEWYQRLKTRYPSSPYAKSLEFYW